MANYILCPRCELNFIDADTQEYCDVCIKEMQGAKTFSDDLEAVEEEEEMELCPVCGENYMHIGDKMCEECRKKLDDYEEEETDDPDKDDAWRSYLDDDTDDLDIPIPEGEFDDEFEDDDEDEEDDEEEEEEDFEYVSPDDYLDDEEDDDEDDEFDDDDAPTPRSGSGKKRRDDDF